MSALHGPVGKDAFVKTDEKDSTRHSSGLINGFAGRRHWNQWRGHFGWHRESVAPHGKRVSVGKKSSLSSIGACIGFPGREEERHHTIKQCIRTGRLGKFAC